MASVSNSTLKPTIISTEDCREAVRQRLQTSDFRIVDMFAEPFSDCPGGFMGDHWRVKVHVLPVGDSSEVQELQFFAKTIPQEGQGIGSYVDELGTYKKETAVLGTLLPVFKKFDSEKNARAKASGFRSWPWTCESYVVKPQYIILEDLSKLGFVTPDKNVCLDFHHCRVLLETLASFHAASIVYEEKQSKLLGRPYNLKQDYDDLLFESFMVDKDGHPGKTIFMAGFQGAKALVDLIPKYGKDSKHYKTIEDKFFRSFGDAARLAKESAQFRNVLCHGDVWANNILFRYENNLPVECRLVDFQLARYAPPATDVMMALHTATSRELREAHLEELLALYHKRLVAELEADVLPWAQFRASCVEAATFARVVAVEWLTMALLGPELLRPAMVNPEAYHEFMMNDRTSLFVKAFHVDVRYRERNTEALEELVDHCILSTCGS